MKVTASINFENKKAWNGLRKHLEHDRKLDHKNKFLNTEESKQRRKLNQWIKFYDFDDLIEDKFSDYIVTQNKKNMDKGRLERCWHSIHDFERKSASGTARTRTLDKLAVFTFSNEDDFDDKIFKPMVKAYASKYPNKSDQEIDDKIRGCISHGLIRYTKGFNKRNPNLIMIEGVTHMDEKGSPHVHARVLPYVPSKIKNGKPKWSVNNALRQQFGHRDTRDNMKDFRDKEDRAILQAINEQIQIELPEIAKEYQFELVRLHPAVKGLEHDEYKAIKQREDIKKNNQRLVEQQNKLNSLKKQIKDAQSDLNKQQANITKKSKELDRRAEKLDKRENDMNAKYQDKEMKLSLREDKVAAKEKENNARTDDLNKREDKINEQARANADMLMTVQQEIKNLKQWKEKTARAFRQRLDNWKIFAGSIAFRTASSISSFVAEHMARKGSEKQVYKTIRDSKAFKDADYINRNAQYFPDRITHLDALYNNGVNGFSWNKTQPVQVEHDKTDELEKADKAVQQNAKKLRQDYKSVLTNEQLAKLDSMIDDSQNKEQDNDFDY